MTLPAAQSILDATAVELALVGGDLKNLNAEQRVLLYIETCKSLAINHLTKPFDYLELNGKLVLYPNRACTDQLRKTNKVSLHIVSQDVADGVLTIHVRASLPDGRTDEDIGTVAFIYPRRHRNFKTKQWEDHPKAGKPLENEDRANAVLKALTKAKRRATLSICGLGWADESEIESTPGAGPIIGADVIKPIGPAEAVSTPANSNPAAADQAPAGDGPSTGGGTPIAHDKDTGEVLDDTAAVDEREQAETLRPAGVGKIGSKENLFFMAKKAASNGSDFFWKSFWEFRNDRERRAVKDEPGLGNELKELMAKADEQRGKDEKEFF
jgi:hypothetical protein